LGKIEGIVLDREGDRKGSGVVGVEKSRWSSVKKRRGVIR
jgi:hypothetical protein